MPYSAGRMLATKIAHSARNSGRIYLSLPNVSRAFPLFLFAFFARFVSLQYIQWKDQHRIKNVKIYGCSRKSVYEFVEIYFVRGSCVDR